MTPEGYEKINKSVGPNYIVEPVPEEGEDLLYLTVLRPRNDISPGTIIPAEILNSLIKKDLTARRGDYGVGSGEPRLTRVHTGEFSMTFRDLNAEDTSLGYSSGSYHRIP